MSGGRIRTLIIHNNQRFVNNKVIQFPQINMVLPHFG